MFWVFWMLLLGCAIVVAWQDFKARLISLWLVLLFAAITIAQYLFFNSLARFLENTLFCTFYFLFCFLVLFLFYFIKNRKRTAIMDQKIGWGDILVFFPIGCCLEPVIMIWFFTGTFILSLLLYSLFLRNKKTIPLAGFVVIFYVIYIACEQIL